ncbi:MAG: hypothetical protein LBU25_05015 [Treponema sp.]|jgi:hypothetical protein|nr:hypothetical protein [Treponema sp.]
MERPAVLLYSAGKNRVIRGFFWSLIPQLVDGGIPASRKFARMFLDKNGRFHADSYEQDLI